MDLWIQQGLRSQQMQNELPAATRPTVTVEGNSQRLCKWSILWRTIIRRSILSLKCHVESSCNSIYTLKKSSALTVDTWKKLTNSQQIFVDISYIESFQTLMDKNFIAAFQWSVDYLAEISTKPAAVYIDFTRIDQEIWNVRLAVYLQLLVTQECYWVSCHYH